ncbi:hypothetical protein JMA_25750 [Jeotgalibacillus malaysiensis]|uniref:Uncharacterized protein n=1 Tax=Jeotgalibacillus malaysiensis TaxID=1508404 RepID=A0A0B5AT72_9BACL|nr:hypothetical protein [Jeotgalibacillus malaysiensis]AJD91892.1 hypothetical protein JMA_25750 [Jeotgalibacillus malaysiensis]
MVAEWFVLQLFLYFPEDKSEYLPAALWLLLFVLMTYVTYKWIVRVSKRQADEAKKLEEKMMNRKDTHS